MIFAELDEFNKDLKKHIRKYRSLEQDIAVRKTVLGEDPIGPTNHTNQISGLKINSKIYKTRLMCRSIKRSDNFRLIYCHSEEESKITFIELYFKGDKEMEDRERIFRYFD